MPLKGFDDYGEIFDPEDNVTEEQYRNYAENQARIRRDVAERDILNEVGQTPIITEEILTLRKKYEDDYIQAHADLFKQSTGRRPFGPIQIESVNATRDIIMHGGHIVIIEPRGMGKTTRTANNGLLGVLQGKCKYLLILASSVEKGEEILEGIKAELAENEELARLYPAVMACFKHAMEAPARAMRQTYMGVKTYIRLSGGTIRFPILPGEVSSGAIIQVRPKDNVRGLVIKIKAGPDAGKNLRPELVMLDDIQTDEEANSPTSVYKIIQTIKKSVLYAGTHFKPVSCVMCATPIAPGDVPTHFYLNEDHWYRMLLKMLPKMPERMDMWLGEYANRLKFDRSIRGAKLEAELSALKYFEENKDEMLKGAEWGWDWAYNWEMQPQTEIHAVQHAINFLIRNGEDSFESECQCNIVAVDIETEGIKATIDDIMGKTTKRPRLKCAVDTKYVVTHIDVNKNLLTYVTAASPQNFRPEVIDYGEWPEQKGATWKKTQIIYSLRKKYPDITEDHERIYQGLKDLINYLGAQIYTREDGVKMLNNHIVVDMRYEIDSVQRAIIDSNYRNITCCYAGQGVTAKDKPFMDRHYGNTCQLHFHCATTPTTDRIGTVLYTDVNYFKSLAHKGWLTREGISGSLSLFSPETSATHLLYAKQCVAETPAEDVDEKSDRRVIIWKDPPGGHDNEYFDNTVGCLAALFKAGCEMNNRRKPKGTYDIQDYVNTEKPK
jgi:hypothetical protein